MQGRWGKWEGGGNDAIEEKIQRRKLNICEWLKRKGKQREKRECHKKKWGKWKEEEIRR